MIERLHVENFKSLRDLDVALRQLSVIVGPNGCGKTSVLQAIKLVNDVSSGELENTQRFLSRISEDLAERATVTLVFGNDDVAGCTLQRVANAEELEVTSHETGGHLGTLSLYHLDRRIMEQPAYAAEISPAIGPNGENLADVLDAFRGDHPQRFKELELALRRMVPGFDRLRLPRRTITRTNRVLVNGEFHTGTDRAVGHQVVFDFDHAKGIVAEQASEGTLLLLGLLTILATHDGPMTLMLDDLDRALHPKAQKQLVEHLRQLLAERPGLQIIATSHSPYLVEHLEYEEVLAMTQDPSDGSSHIAPLLDHPDAARWREEMSAGEFWSTVGEDWVRESKAG